MEVMLDAARSKGVRRRVSSIKYLAAIAWFCVCSLLFFSVPASAQTGLQPEPAAMTECESWAAANNQRTPGVFSCVDVGNTATPPSLDCGVDQMDALTKGVAGIASYSCGTSPLTAKNLGNGTGHDGGEGRQQGGSSPGCKCTNGSPLVADPINSSTGNKFLQEDDYPDHGWLTFRRFYNSMFYNSATGSGSAELGLYWRHSFDRTLVISGSPASSILTFRPDGSQEIFTKTNDVWTTTSDISDTLTEIDNAQGVPTSYIVFIAAQRHYEIGRASCRERV